VCYTSPCFEGSWGNRVKRPLAGVLLLALLVASVAASFIIGLKQNGLELGYPLEVSWVYYAYAQNLSHGELFALNPGGKAEVGTTSPLWMLLLTPAFWLGSSVNFLIWWDLTLGLLFLLATAALLYLHFRRHGELFAFMVAVSVILSGRLVWSSLCGMETCLFCFLSLASWRLAVAVKRGGANPLWLGLLLALLIYARPEGYLLAALLLGWLVLDASEPMLKLRLRRGVIAASLAAALVLPYLLTCLAAWGHPFPIPVYARHQHMTTGLLGQWLWDVAVVFLTDNFVVFALATLGFVLLFRSGEGRAEYAVAAVWILSLVVLQHYRGRFLYHHARYQVPLIPFVVLLAAWATVRLKEVLMEKGWSLGFLKAGVFPATIFAVAVAINVADIPLWRLIYRENVKRFQLVHLKLADYIREHVPPDSVVAVDDVGVIAFFGGHDVVDIVGTVSSDVCEQASGYGLRPFTASYVRFLAGYILGRPDIGYVAVTPGWFPFERMYPDAFIPVYETSASFMVGPNPSVETASQKKRLYLVDREGLKDYMKLR